MASSRKNRALYIDQEAVSALALLKSGMLSPVTALMNEKQSKEVLSSGMFMGKTFPFPLILSPSGKVNETILTTAHQGEILDLICDNEIIGELCVDEVYPIDPRERLRQIYGTEDLSHPGVSATHKRLGKYAICGDYSIDLSSVQSIQSMIKEAKEQIGAQHATALFMAANPLHMPTSTQTRVYVWENTIKLVKEHPIFGIGGGQWWIEYPKYGLDRFEHDIRNGTMLFQRPHNDFLWILSENGIVGFLFYMIIYIGILVVALYNFIKQNEWPVRIFSALAFAFLIGFMVDMFVSFPRERVTHNSMLAILFALVLLLVPCDEKSQKRISSKFYKTALIFFILLITTLNVWAAKQFFSGEKAARAIKYGIKTNNFNLTYRAARSVQNTLYTLDNFTTPIKYYEGVALTSLKNLEGAKQTFLEAYKINPYHLQVINNLATCYDLTGDKQTALKYYQLALDISPRYKEALINKSIVHYNLNEFDKSMEYILKVPANEKNPEKFEATMITICKRKAIGLLEKCDEQKFKNWISDPNKVKATFVKVQKEKANFDVILLQELSK